VKDDILVTKNENREHFSNQMDLLGTLFIGPSHFS